MRYSQLSHRLLLISFIFLAIVGCQDNKQQTRIYEMMSPYSFEETIQNLDIAISEYNYRIIHRSQIGQAVRDRGESQYPLSTITSFCNITYAKQMFDINPVLINEMPCNIAVRQTVDGKVVISTKLMDEEVDVPAQKIFAQNINDNLRGIIQSSIE